MAEPDYISIIGWWQLHLQRTVLGVAEPLYVLAVGYWQLHFRKTVLVVAVLVGLWQLQDHGQGVAESDCIWFIGCWQLHLQRPVLGEAVSDYILALLAAAVTKTCPGSGSV